MALAGNAANQATKVWIGVAVGAAVGIGIALAFPFLLVFAFLFASADAVFSSAITNLFDFRNWSIGELIGRALVAATFAWVAGGLFLLQRDAGRERPDAMPWSACRDHGSLRRSSSSSATSSSSRGAAWE